MSNSHAQATYASWARLKDLEESKQPIELSGSNLTIADVIAVSLYGPPSSLLTDFIELPITDGS